MGPACIDSNQVRDLRPINRISRCGSETLRTRDVCVVRSFCARRLSPRAAYIGTPSAKCQEIAGAPLSRLLDEALELLAPARVAQLPERLGLDLADALAGDLELLAHLFQRVVRVFADAETPPKHLLLAVRQRVQHLADLQVEVVPDGELEGRGDLLVLDKVAQMAVLLLADGRLKGD